MQDVGPPQAPRSARSSATAGGSDAAPRSAGRPLPTRGRPTSSRTALSPHAADRSPSRLQTPSTMRVADRYRRIRSSCGSGSPFTRRPAKRISNAANCRSSPSSESRPATREIGPSSVRRLKITYCAIPPPRNCKPSRVPCPSLQIALRLPFSSSTRPPLRISSVAKAKPLEVPARGGVQGVAPRAAPLPPGTLYAPHKPCVSGVAEACRAAGCGRAGDREGAFVAGPCSAVIASLLIRLPLHADYYAPRAERPQPDPEPAERRPSRPEHTRGLRARGRSRGGDVRDIGRA